MKYIIIGGVAGGATTAARLRRLDEDAEIILIEQGEYISYANCGLPYYIGGVIQEREKLFIQSAEAFEKRFRIKVKVNTRAIKINRSEKSIQLFNLKNQKEYSENYDKLIISTGAKPVIPNIKGSSLPGIFTVRNVEDTDLVKAFLKNKNIQNATVVGGGFIGVEMLENIKNSGVKVQLVERAPQILTMLDSNLASIVQKTIEANNVHVMTNNGVEFIESGEDENLVVHLSNNESFETDMIVMSAGVKPRAELAVDADLEIGKSGGILVNEYMQSSDENIYALGDVVEFKHPISGEYGPVYLAGPANKQGRICADNIVFGNKNSFKGSVASSIVKVFNKVAAATGMTEKRLQELNIKYLKSITHSSSHAGYYPGASPMFIQILFCPESHRLLGAQIVGETGVDKRIDVMTNIIQYKGTIQDMMEFEQAYAPPFSSAKDPVNMAGFVADNILQDRMKNFHIEGIKNIGENDLLIDVRTPNEYKNGTIPGALNFELDRLRENLKDIPKDKNLYIFCQIGLRGYLASRIFVQNGYKVKNLSGGYKLWSEVNN